jgi:hypothetical protein
MFDRKREDYENFLLQTKEHIIKHCGVPQHKDFQMFTCTIRKSACRKALGLKSKSELPFICSVCELRKNVNGVLAENYCYVNCGKALDFIKNEEKRIKLNLLQETL